MIEQPMPALRARIPAHVSYLNSIHSCKFFIHNYTTYIMYKTVWWFDVGDDVVDNDIISGK